MRKRRAASRARLNVALYGQQRWLCSLNATTPLIIPRQGGFGRAAALLGLVANRDDGDRAKVYIVLQVKSGLRNPLCRTSLGVLARSARIAGPVSSGRHLLGRWSQRRLSIPARWRRNAERTRSAGCHEGGVHFSQSSTVALSPKVASWLGQ